MGKNNRQRRSAKQRARAQSSTARPVRPRLEGPDERELVEGLVVDAALAAEHGDRDGLETALECLAAWAADPVLCAAVAMAVTGRLVRALRSAWEGGWQPADIARVARKRLEGAHAAVAAAVIAEEARSSAGPGVAVPESWAAQLRQLSDQPTALPRWTTTGDLRVGVQLLGMLFRLPVLPHLLPPPSRWGSGRPTPVGGPAGAAGDSRMLAKVRALLAKAESTDFEEEAASLTAKAQELMARHAIDQAMLDEHAPAGGPGGRRIGVDDPYAGAKATLLHAVAHANRCRTVRMEDYGFSTLFGYPGDLDIVEMLYTSLLVQATRAMTAAGSVQDQAGRSRTRSFRQSFLMAFASRIGERLQAATTVATEEAASVHGGALVPVLAGRRAEVDDAVAAAFPHLVPVRVSISNWDGWVAGRLAADQAHLGAEQELAPGVAV